jgi:hypothetical protein
MSSNEVKEGMRRDSVNRAIRIRAKRLNEENSYTGKDRLEFEIGRLKSTIINCEWDLKSPELRGNSIIKHKLDEAKKQLLMKEEELKMIVEKR